MPTPAKPVALASRKKRGKGTGNTTGTFDPSTDVHQSTTRTLSREAQETNDEADKDLTMVADEDDAQTMSLESQRSGDQTDNAEKEKALHGWLQDQCNHADTHESAPGPSLMEFQEPRRGFNVVQAELGSRLSISDDARTVLRGPQPDTTLSYEEPSADQSRGRTESFPLSRSGGIAVQPGSSLGPVLSQVNRSGSANNHSHPPQQMPFNLTGASHLTRPATQLPAPPPPLPTNHPLHAQSMAVYTIGTQLRNLSLDPNFFRPPIPPPTSYPIPTRPREIILRIPPPHTTDYCCNTTARIVLDAFNTKLHTHNIRLYFGSPPGFGTACERCRSLDWACDQSLGLPCAACRNDGCECGI